MRLFCNVLLNSFNLTSDSERPTVPVEFHKLLVQTGRLEHLNTQSSLGPALLEHLKLLRQQEETSQHTLDSDRILKRSRGVWHARLFCFSSQAELIPLKQRQNIVNKTCDRQQYKNNCHYNLNTVLYLIRFSIVEKGVFVAMETNRLCLPSTVQDVLHEQRRAEERCVGLQSAAITQTTQTQLQTKTQPLCIICSLFTLVCLCLHKELVRGAQRFR